FVTVVILLAVQSALLPVWFAGLPMVIWNALLLLVICIGYGSLLESSRWQATVGKRLMGLRVDSGDGSRLNLRHAAARNSLKEAPFVLSMAIPSAQFLWLVWLAVHMVVMHRSNAYQGMHDRWCGCRVVSSGTRTERGLE